VTPNEKIAALESRNVELRQALIESDNRRQAALVAKKLTEFDLQVFCAQWLDAHRILWNHAPNEGKRNIVAGARLKKAGMKKGFPDIAIYSRPPRFPDCRGVAIELKIKPNKLTASQKQWASDLESRGWCTTVCYTPEDFLLVMKRLGWE
jgi:hypothetical protein